jgi:acetyl esterase/lipase
MAKGAEPADIPTLSIALPAKDKAVHAAVVVYPGGGYGGHAMDHEGQQIADWLVDRGIAAFVCKYRLAPYQHPVPLTDAQRAVRHVRAKAAEYDIQPDRIGVWGFSAGGHLASTISTHYDTGDPNAQDPIDRVSCRPDFAILCYPLISMKEPLAHASSKKNLLGANPDPKLVELLSNDTQVTKETPPTFIFHTNADPLVQAEHIMLYYAALRKAGVPAEVHIYEHGPHGVGLGQSSPILATWPARLQDWLAIRGILPFPKGS